MLRATVVHCVVQTRARFLPFYERSLVVTVEEVTRGVLMEEVIVEKEVRLDEWYWSR